MSSLESGSINPPEVDAKNVTAGSDVKWTFSEILTGSATLIGFLILIFGVFGVWLGTKFINDFNMGFAIYQDIPIILIATGVLIAMSSGQFDLSAGNLATLSCFLTIGLVVKSNLSLDIVIPIVLIVGVVAGLFNAFLVNVLRLNPFIATLGSGGVFVGLYTLYANGGEISFTDATTQKNSILWFNGLHSLGSFQQKASGIIVWVLIALLLLAAWSVISLQFRYVQKAKLYVTAIIIGAVIVAAIIWSGIVAYFNWTMVILLITSLGVWAMLRMTKFGRQLYATGGNPVAAALAGINVNRVSTLAYVCSGTFAALAGIVLAADQTTATIGIADSYLLPAYAAAFLSTVILSNGRFHIWGTIVGALSVYLITQGLATGGVAYTWTDLINGVVLIVAVSISTILRRRLTR